MRQQDGEFLPALYKERFRHRTPADMRLAIEIVIAQKPPFRAIDALIRGHLIDPDRATLDYTLLHWQAQKTKEGRALRSPDLQQTQT